MSKRSMHTVYVLNYDGKPLMPTRPAKAKWLIKNSKAKVVRCSPFTIQLTFRLKNLFYNPFLLPSMTAKR